MDQYFNNRQNEILYSLLANPADTGKLYVSNLQALINEFPQSGLLQAMLARATGEQHLSTAAAYFNNRALYKLVNSPYELAEVSDGQIIVQVDTVNENAAPTETDLLEHDPQTDEKGEQADIVTEQPSGEDAEVYPQIYEDAAPVQFADDDEPEIPAHIENLTTHPDDEVYDEIAPAEMMDTTGNTSETSLPAEDSNNTGLSDDVEAESVSAENTEVQSEPEIQDQAVPVIEDTAGTESYFSEEQETEAQPEDEEQLEPVQENEPDLVEATPEDNKIDEPFILIEDYQDDEDAPQTIEEHTVPVFTIDDREEITSLAIDDEVFDEITAIEDIRFSEAAKPIEVSPEATISSEEPKEEETAAIPEENATADRALDLNDEAEKLIIGNIAATDYFVFDRAISEHKPNDNAESDAEPLTSAVIDEPQQQMTPSADIHDVSKYNDEKMPYTFMWWLDKTRKEHAGLYQPYVSKQNNIAPQNRPDDLQQQYYENIFHLNSVEELDRSTSPQTIEFDMDRKEDVIIQRFIEEEPHIKPPSNDKLDNENKAKKSAEDQDELVTETLARIYTDQMLYHKAINTYKKLVLKFPEKSRYFADQIEQLQRKIN